MIGHMEQTSVDKLISINHIFAGFAPHVPPQRNPLGLPIEQTSLPSIPEFPSAFYSPDPSTPSRQPSPPSSEWASELLTLLEEVWLGIERAGGLEENTVTPSGEDDKPKVPQDSFIDPLSEAWVTITTVMARNSSGGTSNGFNNDDRSNDLVLDLPGAVEGFVCVGTSLSATASGGTCSPNQPKRRSTRWPKWAQAKL